MGCDEFDSVVDMDKKHVWHHLTQHKELETKDPFMLKEGDKEYVWDINGKRYLDASSGGVWTVNVGYGRQRIVDAVSKQLLNLNFFQMQHHILFWHNFLKH